jgi:phosphoribosyl 1,2-cyclic phosphodiesterase
MTKKTYVSYGRVVSDTLLNFFSPGKPVKIGNICVTPFLKSHDAVEPCSFSVSSGNRNVAILTDIGFECENVIAHIRNADAVFLESNYDDHMLKTGFYPAYLKKRIASDIGHLSNAQAARLAMKHASTRLKHIFLSHLSANNNKPELALGTFKHFIEQRSDLTLDVTLTSRERESRLVCLD